MIQDPDELRQFLKKIFDDIDESHDGKLSVEECNHALEKANLPHDLESVRRMRYAIRKERFIEGVPHTTGRDIEFEEFHTFYKERYAILSKHFEELFNLQQKQQQQQIQVQHDRQLRRTILMSALKGIVEKYLDEENYQDSVHADGAGGPRQHSDGERHRLQQQRQHHRLPQHQHQQHHHHRHQHSFSSSSPSFQNEVVLKIFNKLDLDGDGEVSFDEFVRTLILVPQFQLDSFVSRVLDSNQFYQDSPDTHPAAAVFSNRSSHPYYLAFKKSVCVFAASATARIVTAPFDRIRIIMQVSPDRHITMSAAAKIIRQDGRFKGWFLGNGSNTIKLASELAVKLNTFDQIYSKITGDHPKNATFTTRMFAGGAAGLAATVVSQPSEVVRCNIAASPVGTYKGFLDAAHQMYLNEGGFRRFYSGFIPTALSIIPFSAVDLTINSILKEKARQYMREKNQVNNYPLLFGCGMFSSIVATTTTFPLYVLRTRIAVSGEKLLPSIRELYHVAGWRGFYRGMIPSLGKIVPASTVGYAVYDWFDRTL